jgi:hypothetical protein
LGGFLFYILRKHINYHIMIYQALLSRLRSQHEAIPEMISLVTDDRLNLHPAPGKWSIFDNIVHLAKYQPVFIERINTMLQNNGVTFERYTAETDPEFETWRTWELQVLLSRLQDDRMHIFSLISNLNHEELLHVGVHKKFGALTITQWTEFFLLHEAHHMFTMFQLANNVDLVS